jgi:hypothetical protein
VKQPKTKSKTLHRYFQGKAAAFSDAWKKRQKKKPKAGTQKMNKTASLL